jgi:hypothetical protein
VGHVLLHGIVGQRHALEVGLRQVVGSRRRVLRMEMMGKGEGDEGIVGTVEL